MRHAPILLLAALLHLACVCAAIPNAVPAREPLPERVQPPPAMAAAGAVAAVQMNVGPVRDSHNGAAERHAPLSAVDHGPPAAKADVHRQAIAPNPPSAPLPAARTDNSTADRTAAEQAAASASHTAVVAAALGPHACDAGGACAALGEAIESAAEGPECRTLHVTGKCNAKCLTALKEALAHKLWDACTARCEIDVVGGAAVRWAELCEAHQPTLLDSGKEALQIVATSPSASRAVQALIVLTVLVVCVALGHRRGLLHGTALRLQKRMKRRSSERSIV